LTAAALGLSPTVRFTGDLGDITGEWRHHILALFRANIARHADASRTDIEVEVGQTIMMRVGRRHRLRSCPPALRGGCPERDAARRRTGRLAVDPLPTRERDPGGCVLPLPS
jgi:hypothetical protein